MKLTFSNALLILAVGMTVVLVGAFLKIQHLPSANHVLLGGLAIVFVGTVWFVLSLYRRRKNL